MNINIKNINRKNLIIISLIILIPLGILSIIGTVYSYNYLTNKKMEIFNIAEIDYNSLDMKETFYHYDELGYETLIGVDLSEHNREVDFSKLKEQNIRYAFLRIGWRGYYDPELHLDARFEEYYNGAKEAGIPVGIYFFSQAINEAEALEEANFVLDNIKDKEIDLYIVYDCESIESKDARTNDLTRSQATNNARAFLSRIEEAGYSPMIYTNMDWVKHYYEFQILADYPVWFAQYSRKPQFKRKHIIWQYATEIQIDGISGKDGVDLNIMILKEDTN